MIKQKTVEKILEEWADNKEINESVQRKDGKILFMGIFPETAKKLMRQAQKEVLKQTCSFGTDCKKKPVFHYCENHGWAEELYRIINKEITFLEGMAKRLESYCHIQHICRKQVPTCAYCVEAKACRKRISELKEMME